jgi:hypothetical protein
MVRIRGQEATPDPLPVEERQPSVSVERVELRGTRWNLIKGAGR